MNSRGRRTQARQEERRAAKERAKPTELQLSFKVKKKVKDKDQR